MSDYDISDGAGHGKAAGSSGRESQINGCVSVESEPGWLYVGVHTWIKIAIIGGMFFFLFNNEITSIVRKWVGDPSWSHGFLIPVFSLYFINQHRRDILKARLKPNYLGLLLIIWHCFFFV